MPSAAPLPVSAAAVLSRSTRTWRTGKTLPLGPELDLAQACIRTHQLKRTLFLPVLVQGSPKLRNLRLETGCCKVTDRAPDDAFPGKAQELADADAGVPGSPVVVGDQDGRGRVIDNRPEEKFEFFRTVLVKPADYLWLSRPMMRPLSPVDRRDRRLEEPTLGAPCKQREAENGGQLSCYHGKPEVQVQAIIFGHSASR